MDADRTLPSDQQVAEALRWIREVFLRTGTRYQVVGGLAARAYGATRPLVDLDFYVPSEGLPQVLASVGDARVWGPEHFEDQSWDLTFAKLEKHGVPIEVAKAEGARFYSPRTGAWLDQDIAFDESEKRVILGVEVEVMPRDQLIEYKRALDRPVDRLDLREIAE